MRLCVFCLFVARLALLAMAVPALVVAADVAQTDMPQPVHAAAMHGKPHYGPDFTHFAYTNPDAPKGGELRLHAIGSYDSFNPYIIKGTPPSGLALIYDTLTTQALDEPFTQYGLLAETFVIAPGRDSVVFNLNPKARFSDGKPVTAADVGFTFDKLIKEGTPLYRNYYADVDHYKLLGQHSIRFVFRTSNPELALILGQLPVLPRHYWQDRDFTAGLSTPPVGSGPYRVGEYELGKSISYVRRKDYWGAHLAVNRGQYNFDTISYIYFFDRDVAREAFASHTYDFRTENSSSNWATEYDFPAVRDGRVTAETIPNQRPTGMQGFVLNIRRPQFKDPKVRQALAYAFDFEWSNANLFYMAYKRTSSYFSNSELASSGLPSKAELALLDPLREHIPPEVFTRAYQPPSTQGGSLRANLLKAIMLLRKAGWRFDDGKLVNKQGEQLRFEILLYDPSSSRIVNPIKQNLQRMGIQVTVRLTELTQYVNRINEFDFDMITFVFGQSNSPGNEQRDFWGSVAASQPGSRNLIGVQNPAVDALIDKVIFAQSREELVTACHALDRVLLWNHYVIPQFHIDGERVAYWSTIARPQVTPDTGVDINTWWTK